MTWKDFSSIKDYDEARKKSYREVRSHWIDIVENYNQAISYKVCILYVKCMVKFNTVTYAGKDLFSQLIHDELPHSFFSATDNGKVHIF